jgi:hypothetical protein
METAKNKSLPTIGGPKSFWSLLYVGNATRRYAVSPWLCPAVFDVRYIPYINPPQNSRSLRYNYTDILNTGEMFLSVYREMIEFGKEVGALFLHHPIPESFA